MRDRSVPKTIDTNAPQFETRFIFAQTDRRSHNECISPGPRRSTPSTCLFCLIQVTSALIRQIEVVHKHLRSARLPTSLHNSFLAHCLGDKWYHAPTERFSFIAVRPWADEKYLNNAAQELRTLETGCSSRQLEMLSYLLKHSYLGFVKSSMKHATILREISTVHKWLLGYLHNTWSRSRSICKVNHPEYIFPSAPYFSIVIRGEK